jgi:anti-sigma regulatory factor (Ser/Thr protein kinase)
VSPFERSYRGRDPGLAPDASLLDSLRFMPTVEPEAYLAVASRFENIELVQAVVEDLLVRLELGEDDRHWIGLAVREAVANAIKHGNGGDATKQVEVEVRVGEADVEVAVRDEGQGFDPGSVADPLAPENLLRPGGRGIFYMKSLMDDVDYHFGAEGTEVILRKRIKAAGSPHAEEEMKS